MFITLPDIQNEEYEGRLKVIVCGCLGDLPIEQFINPTFTDIWISSSLKLVDVGLRFQDGYHELKILIEEDQFFFNYDVLEDGSTRLNITQRPEEKD